MIPTFDEWHDAKYGCSFEVRMSGHLFQYVMLELARNLREYTTEMVRRAVS